jgi:hypothetical protein
MIKKIIVLAFFCGAVLASSDFGGFLAGTTENVSAYFVDNTTGAAITGGTCNVSIYNMSPSASKSLNVTALAGHVGGGLYSYAYSVPVTTGIYWVHFNCTGTAAQFPLWAWAPFYVVSPLESAKTLNISGLNSSLATTASVAGINSSLATQANVTDANNTAKSVNSTVLSSYSGLLSGQVTNTSAILAAQQSINTSLATRADVTFANVTILNALTSDTGLILAGMTGINSSLPNQTNVTDEFALMRDAAIPRGGGSSITGAVVQAQDFSLFYIITAVMVVLTIWNSLRIGELMEK